MFPIHAFSRACNFLRILNHRSMSQLHNHLACLLSSVLHRQLRWHVGTHHIRLLYRSSIHLYNRYYQKSNLSPLRISPFNCNLSLTFKNVSINVPKCSLSVCLIVFPFSLIFGTIWPDLCSPTVSHLIFPLS
jgi:hypothetical protein